jgi:hypothetical protein
MGKVAGQRVTFRASARIGAIAASLAAAAALLLPNAAFAATSIGSAAGNIPCAFTGDTVQISSAGPSYAVPADGTSITAWFYQTATGDAGSVALLVWKPSGTLTYTLVALSPTVDLTDPTSTFALPAPIPVEAGDLIGLRMSGTLTCAKFTGNSGDTVGLAPTAAVGDAVSIDPSNPNSLGQELQLNVAASVEVASNPVATNTDQCRNGGWKTLTDRLGNPFKNQGDCVSFVATKGKNLAG